MFLYEYNIVHNPACPTPTLVTIINFNIVRCTYRYGTCVCVYIKRILVVAHILCRVLRTMERLSVRKYYYITCTAKLI